MKTHSLGEISTLMEHMNLFSTPYFKSKDLTLKNIDLKISDNSLDASLEELQSKLIKWNKN